MEPFYEVRDFSTIREMLDQSFELYAERTAFEVKKGEVHYNLSYTEYRDQLDALCNAVIDLGLFRKRIGVVSDNRYKYVLTYMTAICSGNCIVPIDKELMTDDIHGILETAQCELLFVDKKHISKIDFDRLGDVPVYCFDPLDESENPHGIKSFTALHNRGRELLAQGKKLWKNIDDDPEEMCVLLFTSGTTGVSKGVMLCQRNFVFEIRAAMGVIKIYPEDCGISLLPIHHTFESSIIIFFAPYCGAKVTFCEGFKYVLRNMKEFSPSVFVAVPLVLETVHKRIMRKIREQPRGEAKFRLGLKLCKAGKKVHLDLSKVIFREIQETFGGNMRMIICGGAAIDPQILEDFNTFGIQIVFGYGLTECAPLAV
ncbi:MAG: AMP-binding protein, partial [Clostridia bacterium]|nr:AMP-binding protein [Clostridia bacterium]